MAEDRPYRPGLDAGDILAVLAEDVPTKLDPVCYAALTNAIDRWGSSMPVTAPALAPSRRTQPEARMPVAADTLAFAY